MFGIPESSTMKAWESVARAHVRRLVEEPPRPGKVRRTLSVASARKWRRGVASESVCREARRADATMRPHRSAS